jgi:small Trp-rich protein
MPLVWIGLLLVIGKWQQIGPLEDISWWWICAPLALAFAWFEGLERIFGFDRRKTEHEHFEKLRKERLAKTFEQHHAKRR